ncbi:MAG: helix-turn-helix domain-containing protein [Candidatus Promineifilaceae bacterium]|nr:helix-turn-helix domain-containing protein [Candidatus Promineifilaceae bacterium]
MSSWTFITNHGAVLALIGQYGQITAREIAAELDITERSVMRIINDLESEGYIERQREGRVNVYQVNGQVPLRRKDIRDVMIGDLLNILESRSHKLTVGKSNPEI